MSVTDLTRSVNSQNKEYSLVASGSGVKIERFGCKVLKRPSAKSIWPIGDISKIKIDAEFLPKSGWENYSEKFTEWEVNFEQIKLHLKLQNNGQVGVFPEHLNYLSNLKNRLAEKISFEENKRILNLFAYSGAASIYLANSDNCAVTHVDSSKKALQWAGLNQQLNPKTANKIRFIAEDALSFLRKEQKRSAIYDLIIADPPSFWRDSRGNSIHLKEKIGELFGLLTSIAKKDRSIIFLTTHDNDLSQQALLNIALSANINEKRLTGGNLLIREENSRRALPAGVFLLCEM
ncbi:MAG TPA: class I SAM-dependent methyltransferase [Oligoflexia bacterium]|nr:class I SAM-dependent methyltransferase [Oligoflexia bacterium]HMP27020.1 class I SAM-dependent methyltransferase [Oligoflexia bacterium]